MTPNDTAIPDAARTDKIEGVHKLPLIGAAAVVVFALVVVMGAQVSGTGKVERSMGEIVESRDLLFRDGNAGKVIVHDGATGTVIATYGRGEGAFIRQSMRALAHNRRIHDVKRGQPYRLVRSAANKLSISDPITGKFITLNAFGTVATQGYGALLNAGRDGQASVNATSTSKKGT